MQRFVKRRSCFDELTSFPDVFTLAGEFFIKRNVITEEAFKKLTAEMKRRSFTVGRDTDKTVIDIIKKKLDSSLADGLSLEDFVNDIDLTFDKAGLTKLAPHHLNTVFVSNILTAVGEGRKQVVDDLDIEEFPFRQVVAVGDSRTRDAHNEIDGFTAEIDNPVWDWLKTPFSFNCRCGIWPVYKEEGAAVSGYVPDVRGKKGFEFL